jgi:hypothetical protein
LRRRAMISPISSLTVSGRLTAMNERMSVL